MLLVLELVGVGAGRCHLVEIVAGAASGSGCRYL